MTSLKLYDFQEESVTKLSRVANGANGDDMGLGKTIQAIEIDRRKREKTGPTFAKRGKPLTLVVAPLSVLDVWRSHFAVWQPQLKVMVINPKDRATFVQSFLKGKHDVYVCHWESLRLMPELRRIQWFHVIADEAHRAKNRKAQQTVALKKIPTANKLAMSGTLADNRPDDFWSILNWLYPRTFSSYWRFYNHHVIEVMHNEGWCQACDKQHKRTFKEVIGCAFEDELQQEIKPFYVRRLKEDVLKDLPEKYYTKIEVDLTPQQHRAYEEMRRHMLAWVGEHENEPLAAPVVIAQLTRLQQFACAYGKMESVRLRVKVDEDTYEEKYVNQLRLTEPSSKLDTVMDLILDNPNEQIVVFAQSKQVINMLGQRLRKHNVPTAIYTGDTPRANRDRAVEGFQRGDLRVFAGTIAAGGVGITLTAASTVVFLDRAWSPSVNRQAEDRLHRIGQKNAVQIIDLVARGTVDLGRLQKIDLKWKAIKRILGDKVPDDDE